MLMIAQKTLPAQTQSVHTSASVLMDSLGMVSIALVRLTLSIHEKALMFKTLNVWKLQYIMLSYNVNKH